MKITESVRWVVYGVVGSQLGRYSTETDTPIHGSGSLQFGYATEDDGLFVFPVFFITGSAASTR